MLLGDLVIPAHNPRDRRGWIGVIIGYDEDNDPIVFWNIHDPEGTYDEYVGQHVLPEYRSSIEIISENR